MLLAVRSGVAYVVFPSEWSWWIGGALCVPLVLLVAERGRRFGGAGGDPGASDGGPWAPP